MGEQCISVSNPEWAINALGDDAARDLQLHFLRREQPTFRLVYIARRRKMPPDRAGAWCSTCNIELPVRRVHQHVVQCPSCAQRFIEIHEGTEANLELRRSPGYSGPYHDMLSAVWHEWSVRRVGATAFPDGALAYDISPYQLPLREVCVGTRVLTRRERRQRARAGRRGRRWNGRGSMRVAAKQNVYASQASEPEAIREHKQIRSSLLADGPLALESPMTEHLTYRRTQLGIGARICDRCNCAIRILATIYIEHDAPHVMQLVRRGLERAGRSLAMSAIRQASCFCGDTMRVFSA